MRKLRAGMIGELPRRAAFGRDREGVPAAGAFAGKSDPLPVGRKKRVSIDLDVLSQRRGAPTLRRHEPDIAPINKGELPAVGTEGGHARALDRRRRGRRELPGKIGGQEEPGPGETQDRDV